MARKGNDSDKPRTKKHARAYGKALQGLYGKLIPEPGVGEKNAVAGKFGVLEGGRSRLPKDDTALDDLSPLPGSSNDSAVPGAKPQPLTPPVPDKHESQGRPRTSDIPEWREQANLVEWMLYRLPFLRGHIIKIDNEGQRSVQAAQIAKMMGLCPGAHDLFIARPALGYHGLWLEMKQNKYYPPSSRALPSWKAQEEFLQRMEGAGYIARFAFGCDHGIEIVKKYFGIVDNGQ